MRQHTSAEAAAACNAKEICHTKVKVRKQQGYKLIVSLVAID